MQEQIQEWFSVTVAAEKIIIKPPFDGATG